MWTITVSGHFDAAHSLPGVEVCAALHGHTWKCEVVIEGKSLNRHMMLVDFRDIKECWRKYDHTHLNDSISMPTAEVIARGIYSDVSKKLHSILSRVVSVKVWESPDSCVEYRGT